MKIRLHVIAHSKLEWREKCHCGAGWSRKQQMFPVFLCAPKDILKGEGDESLGLRDHFHRVFNRFHSICSFYGNGLLLLGMLDSLKITKTEAGVIPAAYFCAYTVFSIILGVLKRSIEHAISYGEL